MAVFQATRHETAKLLSMSANAGQLHQKRCQHNQKCNGCTTCKHLQCCRATVLRSTVKHINVATMMLYVSTTPFKFIAHMFRGEKTNCLQANHSIAGSIASKFLQLLVLETLSNAFSFRTVVCSTVHVAAGCF